ncbi:glutaredoxin 3 [soil metagenome]
MRRIDNGAKAPKIRGYPIKEYACVVKVEIYTKAFCGFCARAKALLKVKGVDFEEYDITMGGPKRGEMLDRANGRSTVPQIFIGGRHIGGCDDLQALEARGQLDPLLAA